MREVAKRKKKVEDGPDPQTKQHTASQQWLQIYNSRIGRPAPALATQNEKVSHGDHPGASAATAPSVPSE